MAFAICWSIAIAGCVLAIDPSATERLRSAVEFHRSGDYKHAEELLVSALAASGQAPTIEMAVVLNNLGSVYHHMDRASAAEHSFKRAIQIVDQISAPGDPLRVRCTTNLVELYLDTGQHEKAQRLKTRMLDELEHSAPGDESGIKLLSALGALSAVQRHYGEAEDHYKAALTLKPSSATALQLLTNLGTLNRIRGHYGEALSNYEAASSICTNEKRDQERNCIALLFNRATLQLALDGPARSEGLFHQALVQAEGSISPEDPLLEAILVESAGVLRKLKQKDRAREMAERARVLHRAREATAPSPHTVDVRSLEAGGL